ncbi:MAG: DUF2909 domain-containing protein [Nevskiales bacterium]|nr:DUF2909 domain-containing protein [Nevskiales bacterium]
MLWAKIIVVLLLLAIVTTLFSGFFFLVNDDSGRRRLLTALKLRVALSITLIVFLAVAYFNGWILPHGLRPPS